MALNEIPDQVAGNAGGPPVGMPAGGPQGGLAGGPPVGIPMGGPPGGPAGPPAGGPQGGPAGGPVGEMPEAMKYDQVSGAYSMPGFTQEYAKLMQKGGLDKPALWYIDIRNFRSVNPKFGFFSGNVVLQCMVNGIREFISAALPVVRLGGDRFVLVSEGLDFDEATEAFDKLIKYVNESILQAGITNHLALVGGIYYLRDEDLKVYDFKRALDYTSIAHRNARRNSTSSLVLFTDEDLERDMRRITIEQSIDEALKNGEVQVWYQPQIDYTYGEVIGAEALARWHHPELGWISPAEFVPVLENCGKVHELDLFVWEEACRNAGRWRNVSDGSPVPISVNVSRAEMFEDGILEHFMHLQKKYDLPAGSLHLEVTESAFVEEADRLYRVIEKMRENDLLVEMDDFGSGLSSLHMLKDVPVDVVKLDMGFMRSEDNQDRGGVVLGSVIRMLQGLDTPIIAEGVETLEQAEMLKNMGCHLMQGFHFSHPMPLDEFESYIASNSSIEKTARRERTQSNLEDLLSFDATSSYLFNNAMGGTMLFFAGAGTSESILVNDQFYEDCGLKRSDFGNAKVNPIQEIDADSRATLWRAAAEAREKGSSTCRAKVRMTGRWIDCVMRFLNSSPRGDIYSLNIVRSGEIIEGEEDTVVQLTQDMSWELDMLHKIVPNGFVKCDLSDDLALDYVSPQLVAESGMTDAEFTRRFHNSLAEIVVGQDRQRVREAIFDAKRLDEAVEISFNVHHGYDAEKLVHMIGRVSRDSEGREWFYGLFMLVGDAETINGMEGVAASERIIPFDYYLADDRLVIHAAQPDGTVRDIVIADWMDRLDNLPENISQSSAAKVLATVRDLRHHPVSGFSDIKCNLRGGEALRWYHVNYVCEADDQGNTTIIHGYAQDANDQMGSAKWWRKQAEIDYLTGLYNRNAVEQEINTAMRVQGSGMMFMIDLDNFKHVNDELGHLTGDALLRDVADALSEHFREGDVLGRFGGDEFVAFMAATPASARTLAEGRAQDIVDAIRQISVPDGTKAACSVGVAISHNRNATFYDLLEVADDAMYQSKERGKGVYTVLDME